MKDFNKLSDKQISKLTDEELQIYYKIELAKSGVPIIERPESPIYEKFPEASITLYYSNILDTVHSTDPNVIAKIHGLLEGNKELLKSTDYNTYGDTGAFIVHKELRKYSSPLKFETHAKQAYPFEMKDEVQRIHKANDEKNKAFKEAQEKWGEFDEAREIAKAAIYGTWRDVLNKLQELERHTDRFGEYMVLAGNDYETALGFYTKAFDAPVETLTEIKKIYDKPKNDK